MIKVMNQLKMTRQQVHFYLLSHCKRSGAGASLKENYKLPKTKLS
jgi:hypothetical protein